MPVVLEEFGSKLDVRCVRRATTSTFFAAWSSQCQLCCGSLRCAHWSEACKRACHAGRRSTAWRMTAA
jgi:hypothetical protein